MHAVILALCTLLITGSASAASENIYRWMGPDGKIHYGDMPPSGARDVRPFDRRIGTAAASAQDQGTAPKATIDEADCVNKRAQLTSYKNATRLVERDSLGREHEFTVAEREQLVSKVQAELESQCGDTPPE